MVAVRMRRRQRSRTQLLLPISITLGILLFLTFYGTTVKENLANLRGKSHSQWISPDSHPFNEYKDVSNANHLIMVAGHSVTISGHLNDAGEDESDWFLLDYQKGKGLPQTIVAHIREGIRQAAMDPKSILVFSGGETRANAGPVNEGTSYFRVSDAMNLWDEHADGEVRSRTTSEEFAVDSFENL